MIRPVPAAHEWEFEKRGNVGVWDFQGWDGWDDEELESLSDHYRERASESDIVATVAIFGEKTSLPAETQEYMASEWSDNVHYAGVRRVAFVADGITGMAVKSQLDIEAEAEDFDTLDAAVEWARGE
jgi:hypothetical protein